MGARLVIGNWKMNSSLREAVDIAKSLAAMSPVTGVQAGIAPPFPWLSQVSTMLGASPVRLGAQTCAAQPGGAFTGEVSAAMLAELCDFIIVGHSERRALFGETDTVVHEKLQRIVETGLQPILCVGETAEERAGGAALETVQKQLMGAVGSLAPSDLDSLVIAYEPVWAIGTGNTASADDAASMCEDIRQIISAATGRPNPVLYGGSVNATNAATLIGTGRIDGFLVGGASLKVDEFMTIIAASAD